MQIILVAKHENMILPVMGAGLATVADCESDRRVGRTMTVIRSDTFPGLVVTREEKS